MQNHTRAVELLSTELTGPMNVNDAHALLDYIRYLESLTPKPELMEKCKPDGTAHPKENRAEAVQDDSKLPAESEKSVTPPPGPKYPHPDECEWVAENGLRIRMADLERQLAVAQASLATAIETGNSYRDSQHNLARYCEDRTQWALPMSGHALTARDLIKHLRDSLDNAIAEELRLRAENRQQFAKIIEIEKQIAEAKEIIDAPLWFTVEGDMAGQYGQVAVAARKRLAERMEAAIPMTDNEADSPTKLDKAHGKEVTFLDLLAEKRQLEIKLSVERTANGSVRQRLDEARATIDRLNKAVAMENADELKALREEADSKIPMTDKEIIENLEGEKNYLHGQVGELRQRLDEARATIDRLNERERESNAEIETWNRECANWNREYAKMQDMEAEIARLKTPLAVCEAFCDLVDAAPCGMTLTANKFALDRKAIAFALTPKELSPLAVATLREWRKIANDCPVVKDEILAAIDVLIAEVRNG